MLQSIESTTISALVGALDRASFRHGVLATQIASHGVQGLEPREAAYAEVAGRVEGQRRREVDETSGAAQSLDGLVVELGENAVQYQMLTRVLNKHLGMLSLATTEGRR